MYVCAPTYSVKNEHRSNVTFQLTDNAQKQQARTLTHTDSLPKPNHHKNDTIDEIFVIDTRGRTL